MDETSHGDPRGELERGRALYEGRAWADACDCLVRAGRVAPLGVSDLELLGSSAGLAGRDELMLETMERVFHACSDAGDHVRAAKAAFWAGLRLLNMGELSRGNGWLTRALRLVENIDCVVNGYLLLPMVRRHLGAGELDAAFVAATSAAEIGERFRDQDLAAFARNLQGRVLVYQGRVPEGLARLDEALVAATAGELSPIVTGLIYCIAIDCCRCVYAVDRAREWTSALARWCESQPQLVPFTSECLVHRAEIMELGGDWSEAIDEARRAGESVRAAFERASAADGFYQQAEIHRLRGEFEMADEAYRNASQHGRDPQPGLSLLRLAEKQGDAAVTAIRRVLASAKGPLTRARFLPAFVEITVAVGALDEARAGCEELEAIAAGFGTEVSGALAAHARGSLCLADGKPEDAVASFRRAFEVWRNLGAPYLAARLRVALAKAFRALGDLEGAELELDAAKDAFESLGAAPDMTLVDSLRRSERPAASHGLTEREVEVLRLVATGKTNKAIATELFLSEKTIDRHVSNIFGKVNVSSRSAATAYAYEQGLVSSPRQRRG